MAIRTGPAGGMVVVAVVANGLLVGASLDQSVKQLPARRRIGVTAYSAYSQAADLRNGVAFYATLGLGAAALTLTAALLARRDQTQPAGQRLGLQVAAGLTVGQLLVTAVAAPVNFSQRSRSGDPAPAGRGVRPVRAADRGADGGAGCHLGGPGVGAGRPPQPRAPAPGPGGLSMPRAVLLPVHILVGITAVGCGIRAMRTRKGSRWGTGYLATVPVLCTTGSLLALAHWPQDARLLALAVLTAAPAGLGYAAAKRRWVGWTGAHISGMGGAFIVMLTAFYVDNGPTLPGWGWVPTLAWWLVPSLVGLPVVARALRRHTGTPVPWGGRLRWPAAAPRLPPARPSARGSSHDRQQPLAARAPNKEARRW